MNTDHCLALARYNRWMNEKLYAVAAKLTDEERKRDRAAFFRSIHGTFNHRLLADRVWMGRFTGVSLPGDWMGPGGIRSLDQELYADFDELRHERGKTDLEIESWVAGLSAESLAAPLRYTRKGKTYDDPSGGRSRIYSTIRRTTEDRSRRCSCRRGTIPASRTSSRCFGRRRVSNRGQRRHGRVLRASLRHQSGPHTPPQCWRRAVGMDATTAHQGRRRHGSTSTSGSNRESSSAAAR
jgi:uncharacterized damage-inducible protein DinB